MTTDTPRTKGLTGTFYLRCDDCPQPDKCEPHKSVHPDDCADLEREIATLRAALAEERKIVDRIWAIFGSPAYESLNGKSIYDLIEGSIAALAERQVAIDELVAVEEGNDLALGYTKRRFAAWATARALATKEPQP